MKTKAQPATPRKLEGERPEGCSKGCTGRFCLDALNCDAPGRANKASVKSEEKVKKEQS